MRTPILVLAAFSGIAVGCLVTQREPAPIIQAEPAPAQPAPAQPAQAEPAPAQPGQAQPAQAEPAPAQPGQAQPAQTQPTKGQAAKTKPATVAKLRAQARLHEQRAKELEPILARNKQARKDIETNRIAFEHLAQAQHVQAAEYRGYGADLGGQAQTDLNGFAKEVETSALQYEQNARLQYEISERLDRAIQSEEGMRNWHLKLAERINAWLTAQGG